VGWRGKGDYESSVPGTPRHPRPKGLVRDVTESRRDDEMMSGTVTCVAPNAG